MINCKKITKGVFITKENETAFMCQVAMGVFSIDGQGRIWRNKRLSGSRSGNKSIERSLQTARRAETSESQNHLRVMFTYEGKRHAIYAHRAVWMYLNAQEIPEVMEINHKDGNPKNNYPGNLELATRQENTLHAGQVLKVLGKKEQRGEKNTSAKLKAEDVLVIRSMWDKKQMTQGAMAKHFNVSQVTINEVCLRKTWKHLP